MLSGLASLHCQVTVKWLRGTIASYCIVLYREASKHKELCNGATQGDTAGHAKRSLQGGEDGAHGTISEIERCLMHRMVISIAALLVVGLTQAAAAASPSADNRKTEKSNGITVDDLGRGLKSAAQNIEKEIPKMGSAIGNAVKKITEKGPEKSSSQEPTKQKKRVDSVRVDVSSAP